MMMMMMLMLHSFMVMKRGFSQQTFLCFMVSGVCSLVTVQQPPALTAALGQDVTLPCNLTLSHDERLRTPPVLYWFYLTQNKINDLKVWNPTGRYAGRVDRLDDNRYTSDMSILLKNVQWADSGKYLCKVSVNTNREVFRKNGDETLLMLYDTMIFNITSHTDSRLQCEVNVTQNPGFVLSIFHDGYKCQPVDCTPGDEGPSVRYVTISETISLKDEGEYECQLHLNDFLVTKSIFQYHVNVPEGAEAEKNFSLTCPTTTVSEPNLGPFPEPWFLYGALLLVPSFTLLALLTALLIYRC